MVEGISQHEEDRGDLARNRTGTRQDIAPPRFRWSRSGWLIGCTLSITTALWIAGHVNDRTFAALWPWRGASQLVMLWSTALAMLSILSVVRARALEPLFGGMGEAVRLHRKMGLASLLLLVAHGILLATDAAAGGTPVAAVLIPFWSMNHNVTDIFQTWIHILL